MQKNHKQNLFFSSVFQNETLDNIPALNCASNSDGLCLPDVVITPAAVSNRLKALNPTKSEAQIEYHQGYYSTGSSMEKGSIPCDCKNAEITPI